MVIVGYLVIVGYNLIKVTYFVEYNKPMLTYLQTD